MPPKTKTNRTMILEAAFEIVRKTGAESLNARTIAEKLGCSTQPVLYHFSTVDEIRSEVYRRADEYHSAYLMENLAGKENPMQEIGIRYIRFAYEEKHLFRFLFQSNGFSGQVQGLFEEEGLTPMLKLLAKQESCSMESAKKVFLVLFIAAHGMASLLANNAMEYHEEQNRELLRTVLVGARSKEEETC